MAKNSIPLQLDEIDCNNWPEFISRKRCDET